MQSDSPFKIDLFDDVNHSTQLPELTICVENRGGAEWECIPFCDEILVQYRHAWDHLRLEVFTGSNDKAGVADVMIEKPDFGDAIKRYYDIALPIKNKSNVTLWECRNRRCI